MVPFMNSTGFGHRRVAVEDGVSGEVPGAGGIVDIAPVVSNIELRIIRPKSNAVFVFLVALILFDK